MLVGGQANKERWARIKDAAKRGRLDDVDDDVFVKHYGTLKRIEKDYMVKPADLEEGELKCEWWYGPTGTGKTHSAAAAYPGAYRKSAANKWWDGYQGEEVVIIDDFDRKHEYQAYMLKIWCQRYAFLIETKGGSMYARPKIIIVTSNCHPKEIWEAACDIEPIMRRFRFVRFEAPVLQVNLPVVEEVRAAYVPGFDPVGGPEPEVPSPIGASLVMNDAELDLDPFFYLS